MVTNVRPRADRPAGQSPGRGSMGSYCGNAPLMTHRGDQLTAGFVHRRHPIRGEFSFHLSSGSSAAWMQSGALSSDSAVKFAVNSTGSERSLTRPWCRIEFKTDMGPVGFEPTTGGL